MHLAINTGVIIIALLHVYFCLLEMVFWQKPLGMKVFKLDADFAHRSAMLAANQGLYNLFLSAGLIWSLFADMAFAFQLQCFFLSCVLIAGIYGGITVNKRIFFVQGVPAAIVLGLLLIS